MPRTAIRIVLDVVLTIVIALLLLSARESLRLGSIAEGTAEGARLLFLFMDIGLGVWVIALVAIAVRGRRERRWAGRGITLFALLVGAVVNLLVVIAVGFAQTGSFPVTFFGYAVEAGICTLLAAVPAVSLSHRALAPRDTRR